MGKFIGRGFMSISLEDNELNSNTPIVDNANEFKKTLSSMDEVDAKCDEIVGNMVDKQNALVTLESYNHALANDGTTMNKLGAKFTNIAIESACNDAKISLEDLPIDIPTYETNPKEAIDTAIGNLNSVKENISKELTDSTIKLLGALTEKREYFNDVKSKLYRRLDACKVKLESLSTEPNSEGNTNPKLMPYKPDFRMIALGNGEIELFDNPDTHVSELSVSLAKGATVVPQITFFLNAHSHLFKHIVHRHLDWIKQHKDNVLKTPDGFKHYSFNSFELNLPGSDGYGNGGRYFCEIPGGKYFTTKVDPGIHFGFDGIEALLNSQVSLCNFNSLTVNEKDIPVLTVVEMKARLAELEGGLMKFRSWCDSNYCTLWKDALFDEAIIALMLKEQAGTLNERGLTLMAQAIFKLLNDATKDVGHYVVEVYNSLLCYIEASLEQTTI